MARDKKLLARLPSDLKPSSSMNLPCPPPKNTYNKSAKNRYVQHDASFDTPSIPKYAQTEYMRQTTSKIAMVSILLLPMPKSLATV